MKFSLHIDKKNDRSVLDTEVAGVYFDADVHYGATNVSGKGMTS